MRADGQAASALDEARRFDAEQEPATDGIFVRLCEGLAIYPAVEGIVAHGGLRRRVLAGANVSSAIEKLLPLLDGQRTLGDVVAASGLTAREALDTVRLLRWCDLVEYHHAAFPDTAPAAANATFLARTVHATGLYRNSIELCEALRQSAVVVIGPERTAAAISEDLQEAGVGSVTSPASTCPDELASTLAALVQAPHALVVAVEQPEPAIPLTMIEAACRHHGLRLLCSRRSGATVEIGPTFYGGFTACYDCFQRDHETVTVHGSCAGSVAGHALDDVLAAMTAEEALAVLGHVRASRTLGSVTVAALPECTEQRFLVLPDPGCRECGSLAAVRTAGDAAAAYELSVQDVPRWLRAPGSRSARQGQTADSVITQRETFPASPTFPLPEPATVRSLPPPLMGVPGCGVPEHASLDKQAMAGILLRVGGWRTPGDPAARDRWAHTEGNYGSVRLYSVAYGPAFADLSGMPTLYDDMTHQLIAVRASHLPQGSLLEGTGLHGAEPSLIVIFVADLTRLGQVRGVAAYRMAHLDAGVAAVQLALVARATGLRATFVPTWRDDLASVLYLQEKDEVVAGLALVTERSVSNAPSR